MQNKMLIDGMLVDGTANAPGMFSPAAGKFSAVPHISGSAYTATRRLIVAN
ncbi:MAG: hypothetical protein ACR2O2_11665 [Ruegeria sp.]